MEPINNVGTMDYSMAMSQDNQPQVQNGYDNYSSMPMVYDPAMEEKSNAASSKTGLVALATLALAGIALYGGYKWGQSKAAKDGVKEGAKELADDAKKAFEDQIAKLKKEKEELQQCNTQLQKCNDEAAKIAEQKPNFFNPGLERRCKRIQKALKPDGDDTKKVEKVVEQTADEVKDKADDVAKKVEEAATKEE